MQLQRDDVEYEKQKDAQGAIDEMNGSTLMGSTISVDDGAGPGEFVVEVRGCFDDHPVCWTGVVDRFSSPDELVRGVLAACSCC